MYRLTIAFNTSTMNSVINKLIGQAFRVLFENKPALSFRNYKEKLIVIHVCWIPYLVMIL